MFGILGGGKHPPLGTFADYVVVERDQVLLTPNHLDDVHMAAWPVAGLTAWRFVSPRIQYDDLCTLTRACFPRRAAMVHARIAKGQTVLITGIGGGVALLALQLCLAKGANVFVTSGSEDKIQKAIALGAAGGVVYRSGAFSAFSAPPFFFEVKHCLQMIGRAIWPSCSRKKGDRRYSTPSSTLVEATSWPK